MSSFQAWLAQFHSFKFSNLTLVHSVIVHLHQRVFFCQLLKFALELRKLGLSHRGEELSDYHVEYSACEVNSEIMLQFESRRHRHTAKVAREVVSSA